jgi:hypothetical protein
MRTTITFRTTAWLTGLAALLLAGCIPMPTLPHQPNPPPIETQTVCDESTYPADKDGVVKKHSVCRLTTIIKKGETP